jgi:hypothetical protein
VIRQGGHIHVSTHCVKAIFFQKPLGLDEVSGKLSNTPLERIEFNGSLGDDS